MSAPGRPLPELDGTERVTVTTAPDGRALIDVSALPEVVFGRRALTWWATAGFMLVEGTTLAIVATSYLYLRINSAEWPPRPAPAPDVLLPTVTLLMVLAICIPMALATKAAKRFDRRGVVLWLGVGTLLAVGAMVLRWFEIRHALNVRWDTNAYASGLWAVYVAHTMLLVTDVLESAAILAVFVVDRQEEKHYSDVEDDAVYSYFLAAAWVLLYVLVILGPRWL